MTQFYNWERMLNTYIKQAIEFPKEEITITEELCAYVLELCQDEYAKGYSNAIKRSMKIVSNELDTKDKVAHISEKLVGRKGPWSPGGSDDAA